ncbi:hypothetical protein [Algoriphagus resistens]|uniref:hypothetical protein n=1 Tax=Algoriphagus resistens TaxID=1750590 RepID=UPI000716B0AF|nr:hypothetical protein [Algoriphagus resistens]
MKWLFKKKDNSVNWEQGFVGKKGVVVSEISNVLYGGSGLITVERTSQLFHFYAVSKDGVLRVGEEVEVVGVRENRLCVKKCFK